MTVELIETADVVATLGQNKRPDQWVVGFALETEDQRFRAIVKLERKHCDLMVSNGPSAIDADQNDVELLDPDGTVLASIQGSKLKVAQRLLSEIDQRLINKHSVAPDSGPPGILPSDRTLLMDLSVSLGRLTSQEPDHGCLGNVRLREGNAGDRRRRQAWRGRAQNHYG